jgi:hypothetical protein
MRVKVGLLVLLFTIGLGTTPARAALIDLGNGTVFSDTLGVAFLKDMNTAMTTGFDADGAMTWLQAMAWIEHLNTTSYLGFSDWELASGSGTTPFPLRNNANYLERLIYGELGNLRPALRPEGTPLQLGPFENLGTASAGSTYWIWPGLLDPTDSTCANGTRPGCYAFSYRIGDDTYDGDPFTWQHHATAMRRVGVPEPSTLALMAMGLGAATIRRYRLSRSKTKA